MRKIISVATILTSILAFEDPAHAKAPQKFSHILLEVPEFVTFTKAGKKQTPFTAKKKNSEDSTIEQMSRFFQKFGPEPHNPKAAWRFAKRHKLMYSTLFRNLLDTKCYIYPEFNAEASRQEQIKSLARALQQKWHPGPALLPSRSSMDSQLGERARNQPAAQTRVALEQSEPTDVFSLDKIRAEVRRQPKQPKTEDISTKEAICNLKAKLQNSILAAQQALKDQEDLHEAERIVRSFKRNAALQEKPQHEQSLDDRARRQRRNQTSLETSL